MQKTKNEIINETQYTLSTRAHNGGVGRCYYLMDNGNMCAVGRCMIAPRTDMIGTVYSIRIEVTGSNDVQSFELEDVLKPEYRGHCREFWAELQAFHDNMCHWDENGLTKAGLEYKNILIDRWGSL